MLIEGKTTSSINFVGKDDDKEEGKVIIVTQASDNINKVNNIFKEI